MEKSLNIFLILDVFEFYSEIFERSVEMERIELLIVVNLKITKMHKYVQ